jgi:excisionase family DNA binding protein
MVQGYYTLEEAARILGVSPDELKTMSKRGELRAFQDRGSLRFRTQEVEEKARQRGAGSAPDLALGEAGKPKPTDSPVRRSAAKGGEVFDFSLDTSEEQVPIGHEPKAETPSGRKKGSSRKGPPSPTPKPGSDSDVRLVADGSDLEFQIASDSDVRVVDDPGPKSVPPAPKSPPPKRRSGVFMDSKEQLVGLEPDSDVKIVGQDDSAIGRQPSRTASDSDIRLEQLPPTKKGSDDALLTEEIDLDAEIRKAEEAARAKKSDPAAKALPKAKKQPEFPATSPFELSELDMKVDLPRGDSQKTPKPKSPSSSDFILTPEKAPDSSSDFELTPAAEDASPIDLGSDEFELEVGEESAVGLGDAPAGKGPASGINLKDPADSGISLEQGGEGSDEIEFELTLDAESTPKPAPVSDVDSDSEFELTIDEGSSVVTKEPAGAAEEKDIFETDFDVPALEDESGSEAMALEEGEADLDSSDFDIALSDADMPVEEESGSQVVALEEEEADAGARTVQRPARGAVAVEEEEGAGIDELLTGEPEVEEEIEEEPEPVAVAAAPAPEWGPIPVICLLPCVLVLVLVGLLGFEMLSSLTGYYKPGPLTKQVTKITGTKVPE